MLRNILIVTICGFGLGSSGCLSGSGGGPECDPSAGTSCNTAGAGGTGQGGSGQGGSGQGATGGSAQGGTGQGASGGSAQGGGTGSDPYEQARIDCVDRINAFRATEGKPPLKRWVEAESCTDEQSQKDSSGGGAHANFGDCNEYAQNTCPGWPDVEGVIQGCLQMMWDEGPGEPFSEHGHYLNMSSDSYTHVACGFFEMPNGDIWHNHNFK